MENKKAVFIRDTMDEKLKKAMRKLCQTTAAICPQKSIMPASVARNILEGYSPCPRGTCRAENKLDLQYDVQIIIPAYNVEKYIRECLESVFAQVTHYSVLATVINDGSTDETEKIIADCVQNYHGAIQVEVITQKNRRFSGARNRGLETIKGRYILFLDSDDVLPANTVEATVSKAELENVDMVQGAWFTFVGDISKYKIENEDGKISGYPWGKAYKHAVLQNFQFPEGFWFEDTPISFMLMAMPYRFAAVKDITYGYRYNPTGITATARKRRKSVDSYWITEECLKEFPDFGLEYDQRAYEYLLRQSIMNEKRIIFQPRRIREAVFVLTTELMELYFDGFKTQDSAMVKIENALRKSRFLQFELLVVGD